ncbi:MAG: hypothetical protein ACPGU1_11545 [Myxococcota bacterium]
MMNALKHTLLPLLLCGVIAPFVSAAVPLQMPLQGVLRDNAGAPVVEGEFEMTFSIYAEAESEESVWTETRMVTAQGGQFRLNLGTETPLSASIFAASGALWLGVTVEGEPELPRRPMGTTPYAFQATSAQGLACSGCIEPEAFSDSAKEMIRSEAVQAVTDAGYASQATQIAFDDTATDIGADTVQSALETLQGLITTQQSSSNVNEGAGTVRAYSNQWGLPSYGVAKEYVHVINPSPPKVQLYLYGGENTGFASSNNLIVTNTYAPNSYAGAVNGVAGEGSLQVGNNVSAFNVGDHILIHQTVGNNPGHWELNAVKSVQGTAVGLAKPLTHTYESATGNDQRRAQVVIAASYNQLEVSNGGLIRPSEGLGGNNNDSTRGGIVYIRARNITVKAGGKIEANATGSWDSGYAGFWGAEYHGSGTSGCGRGASECRIENGSGNRGNSPNCSGGGGGYYTNSYNSSTRGGGGGGNKTAGQDSYSSGYYGRGGLAKGSADGATLEFGGGGGDGVGNGGRGGGIVVLGAKTIIVESGGVISANGANGDNRGDYGGGGGGAGGSVVFFAENLDNQGTVTVNGGNGGDGYSNTGDGGDGGEGWVLELDPIPGAVNQSYATGVEIYVDGQEVTPQIGDPNGKGSPHWNAEDQTWGATGTQPWSSGPLDLTNVADWTLGEHTVEFKETGGAGGDLKAYLYLIQTFSESSPPANDTCTTPLAIDLSEGPVVLSGTTEDVMGKVQATDANSADCGGEGGADVTFRIDLAERSLINVAATSPFPMRLYLRSESCSDGEVVYCATDDFSTTPLEPGTYFLVVDADEPGAKGNFTLGVSLTPALLPINDTCETAVELIFSNAGIATHTSSTLYSLDQYSAFCGGDGGPDLVYAFTAGTGEAVDIAVTSDDFTPVLHLYKGACAEPESIITCTDTGSIQIPGGLGGDYWLVVDSPGEAEWGDYDLTVTLN